MNKRKRTNITNPIRTPVPSTQFDPYIREAKINCHSLSQINEYESLLLQGCPCERIFDGDENYHNPTESEISPDYRVTRIFTIDENGNQRVTCIPTRYVYNVWERERISNPKQKGIIYQLEKNAAYQRYLPEWSIFLNQTFEQRFQLLRSALNIFEEKYFISLSISLPELDLPPTLDHIIKRLDAARDNFKKLIDQESNLLEFCNQIIQQWVEYNNAVTNTLSSVTFRGEKILFIEGLDPFIEWGLGVTEGVIVPSDPSRVPLAFLMKNQFSNYRNKILSLVENVDSVPLGDGIDQINKLQLDMREFLIRTMDNFTSTESELREEVEREFQFLFRFPRLSSSEVADDLMSGGEYKKLPSQMPVEDLYAITTTDPPSTIEFWARNLLSRYVKEPNRVPNRLPDPLNPGKFLPTNENLSDFLKHGYRLESPDSTPIWNEQFLYILRMALQEKSIHENDLLLAQLGHDLAKPIKIDPYELSLFPPYIQIMAKEYNQIISDLKENEYYNNDIEQYSHIKVYLESLDNFKKVMTSEFSRLIPNYSINHDPNPFLNNNEIAKLSPDLQLRYRKLKDQFTLEAIESLLKPHSISREYPLEKSIPFPNFEVAKLFVEDKEKEPLGTSLADINGILNELYYRRAKLEPKIATLQPILVDFTRKINGAIAIYLTRKNWPSEESVKNL